MGESVETITACEEHSDPLQVASDIRRQSGSEEPRIQGEPFPRALPLYVLLAGVDFASQLIKHLCFELLSLLCNFYGDNN